MKRKLFSITHDPSSACVKGGRKQTVMEDTNVAVKTIVTFPFPIHFLSPFLLREKKSPHL
jgi:hypothetical protein